MDIVLEKLYRMTEAIVLEEVRAYLLIIMMMNAVYVWVMDIVLIVREMIIVLKWIVIALAVVLHTSTIVENV